MFTYLYGELLLEQSQQPDFLVFLKQIHTLFIIITATSVSIPIRACPRTAGVAQFMSLLINVLEIYTRV
jgi:hypothetical protein